jgi:hypothetical protein
MQRIKAMYRARVRHAQREANFLSGLNANTAEHLKLPPAMLTSLIIAVLPTCAYLINKGVQTGLQYDFTPSRTAEPRPTKFKN